MNRTASDLAPEHDAMGAPTPETSRAGPLDDVALTRYQILIIALTVLMAALDGFDAFSMAFVAPVVGHAWGLNSAALGLLLSSGFAGMALGSFFISPIADVRGRRPVVLGSLILMVIGSLLSAAAPSLALLAISRVITGLGLGAVIALTTSIAAEFSNARYRTFIVSVAAQGFPVGNMLGGLASAALLKSSGWRAVFLAGGVTGAILLVLIAIFLLESPAYLAARQAPDAMPRLNRVLARLGHAPIAQSPPFPQHGRASFRALFAPETAKATLQLMLANVLLVMASYYLLSWLPQFVASNGFTPATASLVAAITASSGVIGGFLLGGLAMLVKPARVAALSMVIVGLSIAVIGSASHDLSLLIAAAVVFGFFLSGSIGLLYAIMTQAFAPLARTSAMGLILGAGRIAGAVGPALAGLMLTAGLGRGAVSALFATGPIVAGAVIVSMKAGVQTHKGK